MAEDFTNSFYMKRTQSGPDFKHQFIDHTKCCLVWVCFELTTLGEVGSDVATAQTTRQTVQSISSSSLSAFCLPYHRFWLVWGQSAFCEMWGLGSLTSPLLAMERNTYIPNSSMDMLHSNKCVANSKSNGIRNSSRTFSKYLITSLGFWKQV